MDLVIYCADVGSVPRGNFGWARRDGCDGDVEQHRGGTEIVDLVEMVAEDLAAGRSVALGFESPLYIPVPENPLRLGAARANEGTSWSAGPGAGVFAAGVAQVAWVLAELRARCKDVSIHLDWETFTTRGELYLWEAFVTGTAKAETHIDDATVAVDAFHATLPDPRAANTISAERPLSLVGAAVLWSGFSDDLELLRTPCLVVKALPRATAMPVGEVPDATREPRANRDPRELARKLELLHASHVAPLTEFVRRLHELRGNADVPWFDPTEAGVGARILLLLENPGRRAAVDTGSGFISADNDDRSAFNMWHILREAGVERRRDIVAANVVPWYLGDETSIGSVRTRDLDEARPALLELLSLLPNLRVVVLLGKSAARGWRRVAPDLDAQVIEVPHPSGRWLNSHPEDRAKIVAALAEAGRLARER